MNSYSDNVFNVIYLHNCIIYFLLIIPLKNFKLTYVIFGALSVFVAFFGIENIDFNFLKIIEFRSIYKNYNAHALFQKI